MVDTDQLLEAVKQAAAEKKAPGPQLRAALAELSDPMLARRIGKLLGTSSFGDDVRPARIGVLATCTPGAYPDLLRTTLVGAGLAPEISVGPYGRFEISLATSHFAGTDDETVDSGEPEVVSLLLDESYFLPAEWDPTEIEGLADQLQQRLADLRALLAGSTSAGSATLLLHTIPLPAELRDTVISWQARTRLARAWHQLNAGLLELAEENSQLAVIDLVSVLAEVPAGVRDDRLHRYGDLPYTDAALLALAQEVRRFVQARSGRSRKVLALDLDNTLWGGVLGEVGAEGIELGGLYPGNCYQKLQQSISRLRDQGVILLLASKNDADLANQVLTEHPEMLLRPEAFSAIAVNWSAKAGSLRAAAESLSLSPDSFAFMDDSPFEREHVADELPEVALIDASGDPAHLVRNLLHSGWFDVLELTGTDTRRPELYRTRALRNDFSSSFGSSEDYLRALGIELEPAVATDYTVPRVAQLSGRTNQFNLTGRRYDETRTGQFSRSTDHLVASFAVKDRFGDEGIIGAAWLECGPEVWRVLNVVLSCRVLGRGVELAIADWLARQARDGGATHLEASFVPSGKNAMAAGFWSDAGFTRHDDSTNSDGEVRYTADLRSRPDHTPDWINVREGSEIS